MMGDNSRFGHNNSNRNYLQFEANPNGLNDLFLRSESPRVQQILLHQKLKDDIEKNSAGRVRYIDSELNLRNNSCSNNNNYQNLPGSPSSNVSKVQNAKLNLEHVNIDNKISINNKQSSSKIPLTALPATTTFTPTTAKNDMYNGSEKNNYQDDRLKLKQVNTISSSSSSSTNKNNKHCQICFIKEVRQDLMNMNEIVQEQNEQIMKLKDKCLRSYFERQVKN